MEAMGRATSASETTSRSSPNNVDGSCAALRVFTVTIPGIRLDRCERCRYLQ